MNLIIMKILTQNNKKRSIVYIKDNRRYENIKIERKPPSIKAFRNLTLRIKLRNKGSKFNSIEDEVQYNNSYK